MGYLPDAALYRKYVVLKSTKEPGCSVRTCEPGMVEPDLEVCGRFDTYKNAVAYCKKMAAKEPGRRFYVTRTKVGFVADQPKPIIQHKKF